MNQCNELCKLLKQHIHGPFLDIWNTDSEKAKKFRDMWLKNANLNLDEIPSEFRPGGILQNKKIEKIHENPKDFHEYPSAGKQAVNYVKALTHHIKTGMQKSPPEEIKRRQEICSTCEYYDVNVNRCKKCGCHLEKKQAWLDSHCPLNPPKW